MEDQKTKYLVVRKDLGQIPEEIVTETLLIGRESRCQLVLQDLHVGGVHLAIRRQASNYHIFNMRPSNPVRLNDRALERNDLLASGDVIEIGPFMLDIAFTHDCLEVTVLHTSVEEEVPEQKKTIRRPYVIPTNRTLNIYWDQRLRDKAKVRRNTLLTPTQNQTGKTRFNWRATSDLEEGPTAIFVWSLILGGLLSLFWVIWR